MSLLVEKVVNNLSERNLLPEFPEGFNFPLPTINKVELYLSFYGNDRCAHCITNSGPDRKEILSPDNARRVIENVANYSIITRLCSIFGGGKFRFGRPDKCKELDGLSKPPDKMTKESIQEYVNCLAGRGYTSEWVKGDVTVKLNFGRPSVRISGGEFYTWPHSLDGRKIPEDERLNYQKQLLDNIRVLLPEYDIFILTNGRFAENDDKAGYVIEHWAGEQTPAGGRIRICISVDIFHSPPKGSTLEQMLERIWAASRRVGLGAPFLYGVTNHQVAIVGRALETFGNCDECKPEFKNVSGSLFNPAENIILDPVDLTVMNGCRELKGFVCETEKGTLFVNNIIVLPSGRLAYCCVCVGDLGDFVNEPEECMRNYMKDPVAVMLRHKQTAANLLNTAAQMDPTIKLFKEGENAAVTGSTCYQLLSGKRIS
jgi:hypothetical protein